MVCPMSFLVYADCGCTRWPFLQGPLAQSVELCTYVDIEMQGSRVRFSEGPLFDFFRSSPFLGLDNMHDPGRCYASFAQLSLCSLGSVVRALYLCGNKLSKHLRCKGPEFDSRRDHFFS